MTDAFSGAEIRAPKNDESARSIFGNSPVGLKGILMTYYIHKMALNALHAIIDQSENKEGSIFIRWLAVSVKNNLLLLSSSEVLLHLLSRSFPSLSPSF